MNVTDPKLTIRGNKWKLKSEGDDNELVLQVYEGSDLVEVELDGDTAKEILDKTRQ